MEHRHIWPSTLVLGVPCVELGVSRCLTCGKLADYTTHPEVGHDTARDRERRSDAMSRTVESRPSSAADTPERL